jgi:hypothetical protein
MSLRLTDVVASSTWSGVRTRTVRTPDTEWMSAESGREVRLGLGGSFGGVAEVTVVEPLGSDGAVGPLAGTARATYHCS